MNARKYIFFGYILYDNILNYLVYYIHNPKPKDYDINLLGWMIAIRLIFRYIDVNSIEKHIRKLFFIESKVMEKFIRNLLIETMVLENWVFGSVYSYS
jgi:hypothetical protein